MVKNPPVSAGDTEDVASIPGLGRSPGVGNSNLLQYSCLRNEQRRLAAYSPYSHKESDTSEQLRTHILAHLYSLRLWVEEDH